MKLPSLKKWRIDRDLTQDELARMAGIHPSSFPRIDRGERGCTRATALKLAEALEVDVKDLQKPSPPVVHVVKGRPRTWDIPGIVKLPSLKKWRIDRDLTQDELARMAGIYPTSFSRIERGERGCMWATALKLAEALEVDVKDLQKPSPPEQVVRGRPRGTGRKLHQTSLKLLLDHTLGSSYMAMPEKELEMYCETLSWEEVIEVVSSREKEAKVLTDVLDLEDENLPKKRRAFFQEVLSSFPDLDICLLAKARRREKMGRGRKELTEAMRELL